MENNNKRLSNRQITIIENTKLNDRDRLILYFLRDVKMAHAEHIRRVYFFMAGSKNAGSRAANRNLNKLRDLGLVSTYARRIGGLNSGSAKAIWHLSEAGYRLLSLYEKYERRKRFLEPSFHAMNHTLAITDLYTQIINVCNNPGIDLVTAEFEPECWRKYHDNLSLRPDLFIKTKMGIYTDYWFFETDLCTENDTQIMQKCKRYIEYYKSGTEQLANDVFPLVVWYTNTPERKERITKCLKKIAEENPQLPKLFVAITPNELYSLLQDKL